MALVDRSGQLHHYLQHRGYRERGCGQLSVPGPDPMGRGSARGGGPGRGVELRGDEDVYVGPLHGEVTDRVRAFARPRSSGYPPPTGPTWIQMRQLVTDN